MSLKKKVFIEKIKRENGASTIIEATLIMPLVIMVLGFLIYTGCYIVQGVSMYSYAQRMAVEAARLVVYPGYGKELGYMTKDVDFVSIESGKIKNLFGKYDSNPYRYFSPQGSMTGEDETNMETTLKEMVNSTAFVASEGTECDVVVKNYVFNQKVTVTVTKKITTPGLLKYLGIPEDTLDIKVQAVAVASDPAEFIRNTDLVVDTAEYLADKIKLGNGKTINENIKVYKEKFNSMKKKFNIGGA